MILQRITFASTPADNAPMHHVYANGHPREIIAKLRDKRGFASDRALALAAGVKQPTLSKYMSGVSSTMELETFASLAAALGVTLSELLGEVPLSSGSSVREMTRVMASLPTDQQEALLAAGRAMAAANAAAKR